MRKSSRQGMFCVLSFIFLLGLSTRVFADDPRAQESEPLRYDLYLYLWTAGLDGDVSASDHTARSRIKFEDIIHDLKMGASAAFQISKGDWFLLNDFLYMNVSHKTRETIPPGVDVNATLETRVLMDMFAIGRQWQDPVRWKVFFGARYFYGRVRLDAIESLGPFHQEAIVTKTEEWVTPTIGAGIELPLNDRLSFSFIADIGAAAKSFNWEVIPLFCWKFNDTVSAQAGYRVLDIRHKNDDFKIDALMHGPIVGVKISF